MRLLDFIFPPRVDEVTLRGVSDDEFLAHVSPRLVPQTRSGTVALFPFHDVCVRAAIHEAKYHGSERAFRLLGSALAEYLRDADDVGRGTSNAYLVPVPLGKNRLKERGFNQVEEIARCATKELGDNFILNSNLLERVKETQTQVSLPRDRREKNMHGAFSVSSKLLVASVAEISNHTYIIVDDVLTTGATLQAAIDALKDAGAEHIVPLALAH